MSYKNLRELTDNLDRQISVKNVVDSLNLKKGSGNDNYYCPFHDDKKPSFIASNKSVIATCASGCGSFNMYQIVAKINNLSYIDSVKYIANLANYTFDVDSLNQVKLVSKDLRDLNQESINYIKSKRLWTEQTIKDLGLKTNGKRIVFPNTKDNEIISYKFLDLKTKDFYFQGNDNSCCFYPDNDFKEVEELVLSEGEWDSGIVRQWLMELPDFYRYKSISCSTGAKSSPLDMISQLSKKKAPKLKVVHIFYDNDQAGKDGALKIADKLSILGLEIKIYSFGDDKKKGYDITDFARDGKTVKDLFNLKFKEYRKEENVKVSQSDYETERSVLLYLLNNNKCFEAIDQYGIRVTDFKDWRFSEIFKTISYHILDSNGFKYCDYSLLKRTLNDSNLQDALLEISGSNIILTYTEFIHELKKIQMSSYMNLLEQKISVLNRIKSNNYHDIGSLQADVLSTFNELLTESNIGDGVHTMNDVLDKVPESYEDDSIKSFVPLFSENMNYTTNGGLRGGAVHIVSGEVSLGKSIFGRQQAEHASKNKIPTMVYVTEASYLEVAENTFAARSSIDSYYFKKNILPAGTDIHDLRSSIKLDSDNCLYYRQLNEMKFDDLINHMKISIKKYGIKFFLLDQLTSIFDETSDRRAFITRCMTKLSNLAQMENVCILVVNQLKQESQSKNAKKSLFDYADMNDLAESSDLQRLAYTIIILTAKKDNPDFIRVHFAKNRGGVKGHYNELLAEKHFNRFTDNIPDEIREKSTGEKVFF